jgi:hypothetical protein
VPGVLRGQAAAAVGGRCGARRLMHSLPAAIAAAAPARGGCRIAAPDARTLGVERGFTSGTTTRLGQAGGGPEACSARTATAERLATRLPPMHCLCPLPTPPIACDCALGHPWSAMAGERGHSNCDRAAQIPNQRLAHTRMRLRGRAVNLGGCPASRWVLPRAPDRGVRHYRLQFP